MHAPGCSATEMVQLLFLNKSGEPPGHPDHQIGYNHDVVNVCRSCNGATLERLRHDCFDFEEVWDQYDWYELTPEDEGWPSGKARVRDSLRDLSRCSRGHAIRLLQLCETAVGRGLRHHDRHAARDLLCRGRRSRIHRSRARRNQRPAAFAAAVKPLSVL